MTITANRENVVLPYLKWWFSFFIIALLSGNETVNIPYLFILVINQLDAENFCFTISLFHASTCFEHLVIIIRRSKLYYTASGIITKYNFDLLMMSTWCSKHVEA